MNRKDIFNDNADSYDDWFLENHNILESELEAVKQMLPDSGIGIEIGAGSGIFSSRLGIGHGVEPSERMRQKAIERGVETVEGFAEDLPIENETYQYAIMITADCFLQDINKAFQEIRRILCEDGIFVIAFLDRDTPLGMMYERNKHKNRFYQNAEFHSSEEIAGFLEAAGFRILDKKQTVFTLENKIQEIKTGTGEGVFAVIKSKKLSFAYYKANQHFQQD